MLPTSPDQKNTTLGSNQDKPAPPWLGAHSEAFKVADPYWSLWKGALASD
jgi:hypothetical protein